MEKEEKKNQAIEEELTSSEKAPPSSQEEMTRMEAENILVGIEAEKWKQLTKRNQKFLFDVDRQLRQAAVSNEKRQLAYLEMTDTLLDGQKVGQTAKHIYGTASETSQAIISQEVNDQANQPPSPDWQIAVDGGLMIGSIFTLITGFFAMTGRGEGQGVFLMGVLSILLNYAVGGYAMMRTAKVMPALDAPKGEKGYGRYFLVSTLAMMGWIGVVMLSQAFLPPVINPVLPASGYLFLGALTLAVRFYLRHQWKIVGGIF